MEAIVNDCTHPRLVHVINVEMGGTASTTYRCEKCNNLLTVDIKPFKIEVVATSKQEF